VAGAGAAGAPLVASISSVSSGNATLDIAASTSVIDAVCFYGTDNYRDFNRLLDRTAAVGAPGAAIGGNATVTILRGTYLFSAGFDLTNQRKINIEGEGVQTTTLVYTGTGHLFSGTGTSPSTRGRIAISNLGLVGNGAAGNAFDIEFMNPQFRLHDLYIREFNWAIEARCCYENSYRDIFATACRTGCFKLTKTNDSTAVWNLGADSSPMGVYISDGFEGPWVGGKINNCTVGMLIEQTALAGTGTNAYLRSPTIIGTTIEGGSGQTYGLRILNSHATVKISTPRLEGVTIKSGTGTLLSVHGTDQARLNATLRDSGSPVTTKMYEILTPATRTDISGLRLDTTGGSGATLTNTGNNTLAPALNRTRGVIAPGGNIEVASLSTTTAFNMLGCRVKGDITGKLSDLQFFKGVAGTNARGMIYDIGATTSNTITKVWESASNVDISSGTNDWVSLGNPALSVTAGDEYLFFVQVDTGTPTIGRRTLAATTAGRIPGSWVSLNSVNGYYFAVAITGLGAMGGASTLTIGDSQGSTFLPVLLGRVT
jgi:hypothetical protein